jgi:exonuclease SbcD
MKICQISDIHYCDKYLDEVTTCAMFAADYLEQNGANLIVLSGDLFDHRLEQNSPALFAAVEWVSMLANIAPVLILQGTLSHDAPNAIGIFRRIQAANEIYVADRIEQITLRDGMFYRTHEVAPNTGVLISCLPSVNKGQVAATVGAENAAQAVGDHVAALLMGWAHSHLAARDLGVPTIVVSHGTVSGSLTEHGVPMMGFDHEYTTGTLFAAQANAVMLGHIHKAQSWAHEGRQIAYPGSLGRLHFGELDVKGFLMWDVAADVATFEFIETPAKQLVEIDFTGTPNMEELARLAKNTPKGAHVRIRYAVDDEHKSSIDKAAMVALFAHVSETKIEGRIVPVQRQRAAGIGQAPSLAEKLTQWCELTNTDPGPLQARLMLLLAKAVKDNMEKAA